MSVPRQFGSGALYPLKGPPIEPRAGIVVPSFSIAFREPAVYCVAEGYLQPLQGTVEGGANRSVPDMKPDRPFLVTPGGVKVGAQAFARERCLECIEKFV